MRVRVKNVPVLAMAEVEVEVAETTHKAICEALRGQLDTPPRVTVPADEYEVVVNEHKLEEVEFKIEGTGWSAHVPPT